jgi:hypothetical protein
MIAISVVDVGVPRMKRDTYAVVSLARWYGSDRATAAAGNPPHTVVLTCWIPRSSQFRAPPESCRVNAPDDRVHVVTAAPTTELTRESRRGTTRVVVVMLQREGTTTVEWIGADVSDAVTSDSGQMVNVHTTARRTAPKILLSAGSRTHFIARRC